MFEEDDKFLTYATKHLSADELLRADDLVVVLKSHLLVEEALNHLLKAYVFKYEDQKDLLDWLHLSFYDKTNLVQFRNLLTENQVKSIKQINEIRNKFAHNLGCSFSDILPLLNNFYTPYESALFKVVKTEDVEEINKTYKLKFGLCVFNTLGAIMSCVDRAGR